MRRAAKGESRCLVSKDERGMAKATDAHRSQGAEGAPQTTNGQAGPHPWTRTKAESPS